MPNTGIFTKFYHEILPNALIQLKRTDFKIIYSVKEFLNTYNPPIKSINYQNYEQIFNYFNLILFLILIFFIINWLIIYLKSNILSFIIKLKLYILLILKKCIYKLKEKFKI